MRSFIFRPLYPGQRNQIFLKIMLIYDINIWYVSFLNFDFFPKLQREGQIPDLPLSAGARGRYTE
jgi:hypothetical protein